MTVVNAIDVKTRCVGPLSAMVQNAPSVKLTNVWTHHAVETVIVRIQSAPTAMAGSVWIQLCAVKMIVTARALDVKSVLIQMATMEDGADVMETLIAPLILLANVETINAIM